MACSMLKGKIWKVRGADYHLSTDKMGTLVVFISCGSPTDHDLVYLEAVG